MNNVTWDLALFDALNFDGGAFMDEAMTVVSGVAVWVPLYLLIIYLVCRRYSWRGVLLFVVTVAVAMILADMVAGVFKHTGLLKHLWESFPVRERPMWNEELVGMHVVSREHGEFGTVSAHAATIVALALMSTLVIARKWFATVMLVVVLLVCYSRIYLACHYPQDILLGMLVGLLSGAVGYWLFSVFQSKTKIR